MAQYGGEQYMKQEGHQTNEHVHNPLQSTTESQGIGAPRTGAGGHGYEEGKHGATGGGILHRTGSGSSSSDDGEGGRRKKKGVAEKIKEKLPGSDHGGDEHKNSATATVGGGVGGYRNEEEAASEKGLMEKIKEKLPGVKQ